MATIQGVYIALFGRPADPTGLAYFNSVTDNGANLDAIGDLAGTAEYQDRFAGMTNAQIVNSIYQSLFGRDAELAGLTFFVNGLEDGTYNINNIAIAILDGAQGSDADILANKEAAANKFTAAIDTSEEFLAYQGYDAAAAGRAFLADVTADPDTIPTDAEVDAALQALVDTQEPGSTISLTVDIDAPGVSGPGVDTTGSIGDDTYLANSRTLNPGDVINGGDGNDTIELSLGGNAILADDLNDSLTTSNVETVQVTAVPSLFGLLPIQLDMLEAIGVTTLRNFNSSTNLFVTEVQNNLAIEVSNVDGWDFGVEFDDNALGSDNAVLDVSLTDSDVGLGLYTNGDDSVDTLNLTVEQDNFVTLDLSDDTEDEFTTLVASGGGYLDIIDDDAEFENVTTVDFSALAGGSFLDLGTNEADVTYTGGAGIDFVGFGDGEFNGDDTVDGGGGSDFLGVDLDDADEIDGDNITNFENVILGGDLDADVTVEDVEDLDLESISIAGFSNGGDLTLEEVDGVVINYLGDRFDAQFDYGGTSYNDFGGTINFEDSDDVTFVVGLDPDGDGQPLTGLEFFADKWEVGFLDEEDAYFEVDEFGLNGVETIDLTLNGDFRVGNARIDAGFEDILETFTITGESDFILDGGTDAFDGLTFELTGLTGGFSNSGVGPSGSQEFIIGDLGSADNAFTNDASTGFGGVEDEFNDYDFDSALPGGDAGTELGSVFALGGAAGAGDDARDIIEFTTDGFGNIAIEGFGLDTDAGEGDVLDMSALGINPGADITYTDAADGLLLTSGEFSGTILLVGLVFNDLTTAYGAGSENTIFGA